MKNDLKKKKRGKKEGNSSPINRLCTLRFTFLQINNKELGFEFVINIEFTKDL